jgi:glycosyltransferase involved in cell wall biosynthesis
VSSPRHSIVLPCYNEAGTLPALFQAFSEAVGGRNDLEVIFVDNGSSDRSSTVFAEELAKPNRSWARVINVSVNQGYGFGILAGLKETRGKYIGWTHADSQYEPAVVIAGFERLENSAQPSLTFLQGRRVRRNWFDSLFTAGMSLTASAALGAKLRDINAQPKLFPREFLEFMRNPPFDFSLDLYALVLARRHGYCIIELPVIFGLRLHGEAKGGGSLKLKWKLTKRTWTFIRKLRRDMREGKA